VHAASRAIPLKGSVVPKLKVNRSLMIGVLFGVFACVAGYFGAQLGMKVVGGNSTPDMDKAILDMANLMNTKLPIMMTI
jgi:hypothetical protein